MAKQYIVVNRNGTTVAGPFTRSVSARYEIDKLHKATRRIKSFWHVEQIEKEKPVATATKKKPSAAQLAARKLFAQRAKAGTLTKKKKPAAKRAKNPAPKVKGANNRHTPRKLAATHPKYPYEIYFNGHRIAIASTEANARAIAQLLADNSGKQVEIRKP